MTDAELTATLGSCRSRAEVLFALMQEDAAISEPREVLRRIVLGAESTHRSYASLVHRMHADVMQTRSQMRLRAPQPAPRRPGDKRPLHAVPMLLGTKVEPEVERDAQALLRAKRARTTQADVDRHNRLAEAAEIHLRGRLAALDAEAQDDDLHPGELERRGDAPAGSTGDRRQRSSDDDDF